MPQNTYSYGENVTLTALPDECCEFLYWVEESNPCLPVSFDQEFSFIATSNANYVPVFRKKKFTVNISSNLSEYCCITGNGLHECGEDVTITITTAACNTIEWVDAVLEENTNRTTQDGITTLTLTIPSISEDFIQGITITLGTCQISVGVCGDENLGNAIIITGENTPNHNTMYYICDSNTSLPINGCNYTGVVTHGGFLSTICGTEVTIIASESPGAMFIGWISNDDCNNCSNGPYVSTDKVYSFILDENKSYMACFRPNATQITAKT